jgi:hypothetical protein
MPVLAVATVRDTIAGRWQSALYTAAVFEIPRLFGTPPRDIPLVTRKHRSIANQQELSSDARASARWTRLLALHPRWEVRKGPEGIYNCFGHVWAGRRTSILDSFAIATILQDDFCRTVSAPRVGDLALYLHQGGGGALHVGEVLEFRRLLHGADSQEPWVLSKLNSTMGEVVHALHDVGFKDYRVVFITDRPDERGKCHGVVGLDV